jgi:hypothetical protein
MLGRHNLLFLIAAVILIPILLGMTPVNFVQKIGAGCPFSQGKQALTCNPCPFNSIISHEDLTSVILNSIPFVQEPMTSLDFQTLASNSVHSNVTFNSVPLRC